MKKIMSLLLGVLCLIFLVASCAPPTDSAEASANSIDTNNPSSNTTVDVESGVGTKVKVENTEGGTRVNVDGSDVSITSDNSDETVSSTVVINSKDVTATIEKTADGTKTEVQVSNDAIAEDTTHTVADEQAFENWCVKGKVWTYTSNQGSVEIIYDGMVDYKGGKYCKGFHTQTVQGMTIDTVYYTTYGGEDIWVETTVAGQKSEVHITQK